METDTRSEARSVYHVNEVALRLGVSAAWVYKLCHRGELPCVKLGGRVLIPVAPFDRLLRGETLGPGRDVA